MTNKQTSKPLKDFTSFCERTSVNGFPIKFKERWIGEARLWIPTGITRNEASKGWRVKIQHAHGEFKAWVGDKGRSAVESLAEAWAILTHELHLLEPRISQRKWKRRPGPVRDARIETGVTGVQIARSKARNGRAKSVSVRVTQRVRESGGGSVPISIDTIHISESVYESAPGFHQARFQKALCEAVAVRRAYIRAYAEQGGPVASEITLGDIDRATIPNSPTKCLDLGDIFLSFD